jgi:hypothetical protein
MGKESERQNQRDGIKGQDKNIFRYAIKLLIFHWNSISLLNRAVLPAFSQKGYSLSTFPMGEEVKVSQQRKLRCRDRSDQRKGVDYNR